LNVGARRSRRDFACHRTLELVSLDLDGEISRFGQAQLAAHLIRCDDCRKVRNEIVWFTQLLRDTPAEVSSRPIAGSMRRQRGPKWAVRTPAVVAAALVLGLGSLQAIDLNRESRPTGGLTFRDQREQEQFARSRVLTEKVVLGGAAASRPASVR
jgi:hypothetical protein